MKTVGEALKGRRERLGMTLTELEQRTGIKREMLVYIENNEFDQLPNKNYSEGFIRKYASVVNIEPNQLIQAHQDEIPSNQAEWDEVITVFNNNKDLDYKSKSKEPIQLLVIMGITVLITLLLWIMLVLIF
ncbi:TPA: helix-turn-helix domain-containing protein [Staphylococcus aureus]|uniref:Helix-turn-helix domain-containing protein n=1 Tax=Staphylococcus aureus TaxID=1280 RepID=A0A0U1ML07_STAAU|nr:MULTISPECIES: RodZ family helix-turn-helix domain-containing protein [Staphylococcus]HDH6294719.1 helix-turn-helix domain-containing protein [Staphylococcus aureus LTCF-1-17]HDK8974227.1 helix-turn-helix domain-containing protein [Staphylococcus aureus USA600-NRS22]HDK9078120.1 helix-turn-helix domain-containing protein [Staphylococcus aureus USA600-BAA1754]HDK9080891.1 helix-turn-helix domain-containing protein [Staphylococcus aureus USA600-BAA1751]HDQ3542012.1 helix-turn-helix domain-cont